MATVHSGWLEKQGGAKGGRKNWKKRWFVIKQGCLYYYRDQQAATTSLLGLFPLHGASLLDQADAVTPKPEWANDPECATCKMKFNLTNRQHHCRACGNSFCAKDSSHNIRLPKFGFNSPVRVCDGCFVTVSAAEQSSYRSGVKLAQDIKTDTSSSALLFTLPSSNNKQQLFALKNSERELWLEASSEKERKEWVSAITRHARENVAPAAGAVSEKQWDINMKQIEILDKVGDGTFGEVFSGRLWGTKIAVKTLKPDQFESLEEILSDLRNEIKILSNIRHPNCLLYMGASTKPPNVAIVTEWCSRGSLFDVLHDYSNILSSKVIVKIAMGVAQGINYLHSLRNKIIHRDLKSHNVLLTSSFEVKVADFGLSHAKKTIAGLSMKGNSLQSFREKRASMGGGVSGPDQPTATFLDGTEGIFGTAEWMAPEVMEGLRYTEKVDIYSFGVLITELLTRRMPFHDQYEIKSYLDVFDAVLEDGAIPTFPQWADGFLNPLVLACISRDPRARPSMSDIIPSLNRFHDLDDSVYFQRFDLARICEQMQSQDPRIEALAAREVAEMLANEPRIKRGKATLDSWGGSWYLDDEHAKLLIDRFTGLLSSMHQQVKLQCCRALSAILKIGSGTYRETDRQWILGGGALRPLTAMIGSDTELTDKACELLRHLTRGMPVTEISMFSGLDMKGTGVFIQRIKSEMKTAAVELEANEAFIKALDGVRAADGHAPDLLP